MQKTFEQDFLSEAYVEQNHVPSDIENFINNLRGREKEICSAFIFQGKKVKEIAVQTGIPYTRVCQILRRSMAPLARELGISVTFSGGRNVTGRRRSAKVRKGTTASENRDRLRVK